VEGDQLSLCTGPQGLFLTPLPATPLSCFGCAFLRVLSLGFFSSCFRGRSPREKFPFLTDPIFLIPNQPRSFFSSAVPFPDPLVCKSPDDPKEKECLNFSAVPWQPMMSLRLTVSRSRVCRPRFGKSPLFVVRDKELVWIDCAEFIFRRLSMEFLTSPNGPETKDLLHPPLINFACRGLISEHGHKLNFPPFGPSAAATSSYCEVPVKFDLLYARVDMTPPP